MSHVSSAWSRIGLQRRLQILIQGFLVVILVAAQFWILSQFEHQILSTAKERAVIIADGVINGLNTLMITKAGDKEVISDKKSRAQFKQKMAASEGIRELRVVRGKVIDDEYDEGVAEEHARDDLDRAVLATGKTEYRMIVQGQDTALRAVLPYIAKKNFRSINCMDCHAADEGQVVGATSLIIDINSDMAALRRINLTMWAGQGVLQIVLFFVIGAIVRNLLRQLGGEPRHVIEVIKRIARGNLSEEIATRPGDEASLLAAMKMMQRDLRVVVQDIQVAVDAAVRGDFGGQTDLSAKQGFGLEISRSLNALNANLLRQIGGNPAEAVSVAKRIAAGDLDVAVAVRNGDTESILAAMATMRGQLVAVIAEVECVVDAAAEGDFSGRMLAGDRHGYPLRLCELLNRLSDVTENGLQDAIDVAQAIARGDLTQKIDGDYPGRYGELKDAINTTVDRLQEMIRRVQDASNAIDMAAREIAQGNQDLSLRTEEAAIELQRTAASMDELNTTVHRNSDRAAEANRLATDASAVVLRGGEMVGRVIVNMQTIHDSSRRIADIIGVMDSIAFQTNILALNAAVEAARAGEQGRGFAVVATEVRSLAQRSAQAAREIRTLIESSSGQVDTGSKLVEAAGLTMDEVVHSFQTVAQLVIEIAQSSKTQSTGIASVTRAVGRMDDVTQQNAAVVEQAAAAAESLRDQAKGMVEALALFKLEAAPRRLRRLANAGPA